MIAAATLLAAASTSPVPFVGCPSDGQQGPQRAPRSERTVRVPASVASGLAWYASDDGGVLAPRGWRCRAVAGSNGWTIIVAPAARAASLSGDRGTVAGPAVVRTISYGGTSGRFDVANVAVGLFPAAARFVAGVRAEGIGTIVPLRPGPGDRIVRRGPREVDFVSAPGGRLGSGWPLAPGGTVRGVYRLGAGTAPDLDGIRVRGVPTPLADAVLAGG